MRSPLRSLRFCLLVLPLGLLVLWLALALTAAIYDARLRISAEVKASSALARSLLDASLRNADRTGGVISTLKDVKEHLRGTRHVHIDVADSASPERVDNIIQTLRTEWAAPSWFVELILPSSRPEIVGVVQRESKPASIYIVANPADEIREVWKDFRFVCVLSIALVIVIVLSILWLTGRALQPLRALSDGLRQLEHGDFSANLEPIRTSEFEEIGVQFNRLAQSLTQTIEENRDLCRRLVSLQEKERSHIARELHDELGPCLFGIRAEVASIVETVKKSPGTSSNVAERARSIEELVHTIQEINRRILHTLQPVALIEMGLAAALRELVGRWQEAYPEICWSLRLREGDLAVLGEEASLAVYRIAQEGLTNIARHAGGSYAQIHITRESRDAKGDVLRVVVKDDGRGFSETAHFGTGLFGMSARVRDLGGGIAISSGPGLGVSIDAFVPLLAQEGVTWAGNLRFS
jgi:two-component system, NarL family, sensor histidine kinase UhpB